MIFLFFKNSSYCAFCSYTQINEISQVNYKHFDANLIEHDVSSIARYQIKRY